MRFGVMDTRGNENVTAQRVIPLKCLRPGESLSVYVSSACDGATLRSLHAVVDKQCNKWKTPVYFYSFYMYVMVPF